MTATNAGGLHVIRWGPMRDQLTGIHAATTSGTGAGIEVEKVAIATLERTTAAAHALV